MDHAIKCVSLTVRIVFAVRRGDFIVLVALPAIRLTLAQSLVAFEPYYDLDVVMVKSYISR